VLLRSGGAADLIDINAEENRISRGARQPTNHKSSVAVATTAMTQKTAIGDSRRSPMVPICAWELTSAPWDVARRRPVCSADTIGAAWVQDARAGIVGPGQRPLTLIDRVICAA